MTLWSLVRQLRAEEALVKYSKFDLIKDMHYYLEGNKVVFTELFHKQRGYCCGSGCKHCPYEPKNKKGNKKLKS